MCMTQDTRSRRVDHAHAGAELAGDRRVHRRGSRYRNGGCREPSAQVGGQVFGQADVDQAPAQALAFEQELGAAAVRVFDGGAEARQRVVAVACGVQGTGRFGFGEYAFAPR